MKIIRQLLPESFLYILPFAIILIAVELIAGVRYPIFRDELYYIDCANHLSWGYVDHPAFSILILAIWKSIFGISELSIRILPALSGAVLMMITARTSQELGGNRWAQVLSSIAVMCSLTYLVIAGYYSMNSYDFLFWITLFLIVIRIVNTGNEKLWLWFGVIAGIGLMNKLSLCYFGAGLAAAMLCTKERRWFANKYFWSGGIIAFVIFLPYIIWNYANDFATLQFISNASKFKNADIPVLDFLKEQILQMNPLNLIIWLTGLIALVFSATLKKYRFIALSYLFIFIILSIQKSKPYYLAPIYTVLFAAGSVAICGFLQKKKLGFVQYILALLILAGGVALSPVVMPVLEPDSLATYLGEIGLIPNTGERSRVGLLPQYLADRFGWEEMTEKIGNVYNSLGSEEKKYAVIYGQNYGEAGAVNYYGPRFGLPKAISPHNSHWLWGPGKDSVSTYIIVGVSEKRARDFFGEVKIIDSTSNQFAMPFENEVPILLCRYPRMSIKELWAQAKMYI